MLLFYCMDPLKRSQPDAAYSAEVGAAERLGLSRALVDFEALVDEGNPARAVRAVPAKSEPVLGLFRGWMLGPVQYALLYAVLVDRNVHLINDPTGYRQCHYLPESYEHIAQWTPRTVWLPLTPGSSSPSHEILQKLLAPFGDGPLILKDYVKSRKHEWLEACFIPSTADMEGVEAIVRRFLELQGDDLAEGLVFRE
jgi:hypothetical protein